MAGPRPRWGKRRQHTMYWPSHHFDVYERRAHEQGLSVIEYLVREMAERHDLPADPNERQLQLGA